MDCCCDLHPTNYHRVNNVTGEDNLIQSNILYIDNDDDDDDDDVLCCEKRRRIVISIVVVSDVLAYLLGDFTQRASIDIMLHQFYCRIYCNVVSV